LCRRKLAIRVAKLDSSFVLGDVLSPGADAVVPRACDLVGEWFGVAEGSGGGEDGEFGGFVCIVGEDKFILVGCVAEFVFDGFLIADVLVLLPMVLAQLSISVSFREAYLIWTFRHWFSQQILVHILKYD
jgi:hypothetical protein